jgi:hypothetical protein
MYLPGYAANNSLWLTASETDQQQVIQAVCQTF